MLDRVRKFIVDEGLAVPAEALWVAVSGGVDSMVLLHVLQRLGYQCVVAHVDHGMRGEVSDADLVFVREHCLARDIPFHSRKVDVQERSVAHGVSIQMAARALRQEWFNELTREGPTKIALAHHRDDASETFLLHMMRGMGIHGWGSIAARSDTIVRPLLCTGRDAIMEYAAQNNIPYREDASNMDPKYVRNRIRNELVPLMEVIRPGAKRVMARDGTLFNEMVHAADAHLEKLLHDIHLGEDGSIHVPFSKVLEGGTPNMVLMRLLRDKGFHPDRIGSILKAIRDRSTGSQFQEGSVRVLIDRDVLVITRDHPVRSWTIHDPQDHGTDLPITITKCLAKDMDLEQGDQVAWVDADTVGFPMELRTWRAGDRMRPMGMNGSKLVSDILINAKVPRDVKDRTWVLICDDKVVWLCGHRIGNDHIVRPSSKQVLRLAMKQG